MNIDLKRRLKTIEKFNGAERRFLHRLQTQLHQKVGIWLNVTVRFEMIISDEDDTAYVQAYSDGSFEIVIDSRLSFGEMCDYLIHEFAHVGTWVADEPDDHGPCWGMEYAWLYRFYLELYSQWFGPIDTIGKST